MKILELESSKGWGGQEKRTVRLNSYLDYQIFWGVEKDSELFKRKDKIDPKTIKKRVKSIDKGGRI